MMPIAYKNAVLFQLSHHDRDRHRHQTHSKTDRQRASTDDVDTGVKLL